MSNNKMFDKKMFNSILLDICNKEFDLYVYHHSSGKLINIYELYCKIIQSKLYNKCMKELIEKYGNDN